MPMNKVDSTSGSHFVAGAVTVGEAVIVVETKSVCTGYELLQSMTNNFRLRILEASSVGSGFLIMAQGETTDLEKVENRIDEILSSGTQARKSSQPICTLIPGFDNNVREALFGLSQEQMKESLVVVEGESIGSTLRLAQRLVKDFLLTAIEIRIQRNSTGGCYGFFTGLKNNCAMAMADLVKDTPSSSRLNDTNQIILIENPTNEVRRYFHLNGEI